MNPRPPPIAERAESLARAGRVEEAVRLLRDPALTDGGDGHFTLARWLLAGTVVPRDLKASRDFFAKADAAGHALARHIHLAFVANGTGGPSDWPNAIALLRRLAADDVSAARQLSLIETMELGPTGEPSAVEQGEILSASPRAILFRGLFSADECDYLIDQATPLLQPAVVVDPASGRQSPNPIRTSDGAAFPLARENPAIHALNRRIAAAASTDVRQGEPLQVLRYRPGQEYKPHVDALPAAVGTNQRILTMLVYLNDDYDGGETCFLATGLKVKGGKGDGLLFVNVTSDGRPDERARHAGLPVTRGEKLLASRWIREKPLGLGG